ncbi:MAG: glycerate kinase [Candidatus Delongbacteria bacterium]|nr:glycerate kinase [Candidatus Delongbacteria bacterium]MBN2836866.1 glycerate kinase [Candidatus Delongbacteria bacterium]
MKIVIAPDSYKNCLTAEKVAEHIDNGIKSVDKNIETVKFPLSDGGEGFTELFLKNDKSEKISIFATDPLGRKTKTYYCKINETAYMDMSKASGLELLNDNERDPLNATTFGFGEMLLSALDLGCKKIVCGIGGSATNDGGIGMAQALGAKFFHNDLLLDVKGGKYLDKIDKIDINDLDKRIFSTEIVIASDVDNRMIGENGATYIYGPQKGAKYADLQILESGMKNYLKLLELMFNVEIDVKGSGAAGGLGGGMIAFLNGKIQSGIQAVLENISFDEVVRDSDLIITGEGKTDSQSANGKVLFGVSMAGSKYKIPVIAISGSLEQGYEKLFNFGLTSAFSIIDNPTDLQSSIMNAGKNIELTTINIMRMIKYLNKCS